MGGDGKTRNLGSGVARSAIGASVCSGVKARRMVVEEDFEGVME